MSFFTSVFAQLPNTIPFRNIHKSDNVKIGDGGVNLEARFVYPPGEPLAAGWSGSRPALPILDSGARTFLRVPKYWTNSTPPARAACGLCGRLRPPTL
jgi:hypothetical protein